MPGRSVLQWGDEVQFLTKIFYKTWAKNTYDSLNFLLLVQFLYFIHWIQETPLAVSASNSYRLFWTNSYSPQMLAFMSL